MALRSFGIFLLMFCASAQAFAQGTADRRRKLTDSYLEDSRSKRSIFHAAPINHIVPAFNTITYAMELEQYDVGIEPEDNAKFANLKEQVKLGGYKVSPYLALSLKHVGIGFSLEGGRKTIQYKNELSTLPLQSAGDLSMLGNSEDAVIQDDEQKSIMDYRAVGVYVYLIPFPKLKEKKITLTLILGGRNYSCRHEVGLSTQTASRATETSKVYPYTVTAYESGVNMIYKLSPTVQLVPWGQYFYADTKTIELLTEVDSGSMYSQYLEDDVQVMWHNRPLFEYGLDLAIKVERFEVRLGGAIGAVASFGTSANSNVQNRSISLAFAYDMKGG